MRRGLPFAIAILLAAAGTVVAPAVAAADPPAPFVVFRAANDPANTQDQGGPIVVQRIDGTDHRQLAGRGLAPRLSPDGSRVAYTVPDLTDPNQPGPGWVCVVAVTGGAPSCFGSSRYPIPPSAAAAWSPDGTRLAFACGGGICVAAPGGRGLAQVFDDTTVNGRRYGFGGVTALPEDLQWSPDGSNLAFVAGVLADSCSTKAGACSYLFTLRVRDGRTDPVVPNVYDAAWSPDGTRFAYIHKGDLWVAGSGGGHRHAILSTHHNATPAWSPDGHRIAFVRRDVLETIRPDGSHRSAVPGSRSGDYAPHWTPGGGALAFQHDKSYDCDSDFTPTTHDVATIALSSGRRTELTQATVVGCDPDHQPYTLGNGIAPDTAAGFRRLAGPTRIGTSVSISRANYARAKSIVVAGAAKYPDALAAAPLAAAHDAPLLLSPASGTTAALDREVRRLGATTAYLVGGRQALSDGVADDLRAAGVSSIHRIAGQTRFATAAKIAAAIGGRHVYLARGNGENGWADAASVAGLAAYTGRPLLLTRATGLPGVTRSTLRKLNVQDVTIVGGDVSVQKSVANGLRSSGRSVTRLAGANRYATSTAVADAALRAGMSGSRPWLAAGTNFPDALSSGPAVAKDGGVLLLVKPHRLFEARGWLRDHAPYDLTVVGGSGVVAPETTTAAVRIGRG